MTYIDIIIAAPLCWFAFKGFKKGFIAELAMLAALLLGIYISINFSGFISNQLDLNKSEFGPLMSFFICFIGVVVIVYLLGVMLSNVADSLSLGFFNHLLGAILGAVKVVFILSICIYFLNKIDPTHSLLKDDMRNKSFLFQPLEKVAPFVFTKLDIQKMKQELHKF